MISKSLPTVALAALGAGLCALTFATVATSSGWPEALPRHLGLFVAAGIAWAIAVGLVRRLPARRGQLALVLGISLLLRVPAWLAPPAHSDDAYRFLWEGRVQRAGYSPYLLAPDAPELTGLRDEVWTHVNNRQLPTIYPPAAELLFRLAASLPLPPLVAWKAVVATFDLGLLALLLAWLARRKADLRLALVWGWSPLVAIELGQNGHLDGVGVALMAAALVAAERDRRGLAGALLGLSTGVKLLAISLLPSLRSWRAVPAFALVLAVAAAPYAGAGPHLSGSLGEYGRRWRANDGAFALLHGVATVAVRHTRFQSRHEMRDSPRLARLLTGRDRDEVYPDEVANFFARLATAGLFLLVLALALRRRLSPARLAVVAVGAFLLLTPTLHPWYAVWMIPLLAVAAGPAWLPLVALVPLGYWPLAGYLSTGRWEDPVWTRLCVHGPTVALLLLGVALQKGLFHRTIDRSPGSAKI